MKYKSTWRQFEKLTLYRKLTLCILYGVTRSSRFICRVVSIILMDGSSDWCVIKFESSSFYRLSQFLFQRQFKFVEEIDFRTMIIADFANDF